MKEFLSVFQLSKKIVFEVNYYTLSSNRTAHFATSACEFNQPKTDYCCCGQCQPELLKHFPTAMAFFKKWDVKHLEDLTEEEYAEMRKDLSKLEVRYNCIIRELDERQKPYSPHISFEDVKALSKMTPKKKGVINNETSF